MTCSLWESLLHTLHETISKHRQKKLLTCLAKCEQVQSSRSAAGSWASVLGYSSRPWGNPALHTHRKTVFRAALAATSCCYSEQARTGLYWVWIEGTSWYSAQSARLLRDLQRSPLPPRSSRQGALANRSCKYSWVQLGSWAASSTAFSQPYKAASSSFLCRQAALLSLSTAIHDTNQPCWATAKGSCYLPLGMGKEHTFPPSVPWWCCSMSTWCRTLTCIWKP